MGLRVEGHTGREHQRAVMTVEAAAVRQQCEGGRGPARGAPASLSLPLSLARPARGGWGSGCTVASFTNHRAMKHCDGCRSASQRPRGAGWGRPVGCPSAQRPPLPSSRRPGAHSGHTKKETVAEAWDGCAGGASWAFLFFSSRSRAARLALLFRPMNSAPPTSHQTLSILFWTHTDGGVPKTGRRASQSGAVARKLPRRPGQKKTTGKLLF